LQDYCRACQSDYGRAYNATHREEINETRRAWRRGNAERDHEYNEACYRENRERYAERARAYRKNNRERSREAVKAYRKKHPEAGKQYYEANRVKHYERVKSYRQRNLEQYAVYAANRLARKKNIGGSVAPPQWGELKAYYDYTCLCCGRREPDITLTMDHVVPIAKGGINAIENIQPLCGPCNSSKGTKIVDYRDL
jgi:5-methylcytosine-specific restriction endonuclease McrA